MSYRPLGIYIHTCESWSENALYLCKCVAVILTSTMWSVHESRRQERIIEPCRRRWMPAQVMHTNTPRWRQHHSGSVCIKHRQDGKWCTTMVQNNTSCISNTSYWCLPTKHSATTISHSYKTVYALQFASIHIQPTINATFTYFLLCTPHRLCFPLAVARDSISPLVSPFLSNLSYPDTLLSKHTVTYPCSEMTRKQSPSLYIARA